MSGALNVQTGEKPRTDDPFATQVQFTPKVSIILVNLNGYNDTQECLQSLQRVQYPTFDIVVVDNGSTDHSCAALKKEFPQVHFLESSENLGFTGGNNLGIETALNNGAEYVLLLNNDTVVDPGLLTHLVHVGQSDPKIGILGAKIFYFAEPQRIWYAGGHVKYGTGVCRHLGQDQLDQDGKFSRVEDTQFVTGCAMMIKSTVLHEIGLLDAKLFIYWEDSDLCMRAKDAGFRCVFVPTALVWHKVNRTCGTQSPFSLYLITRNHLTWVSKHVPFPYKPGALAFTFLKKTLKASLLVFTNLDAARAVWAGIWAFFFRIYGPPRKQRLPRQSAVPAGRPPRPDERFSNSAIGKTTPGL